MSRPAALKRPTISIVGPGNLGSALALTLAQAGYEIRTLAVRRGRRRMRQAKALSRRIGARLIVASEHPLETAVVWITVPDDAISGVARQLAATDEWKGKLVFHSSGALTSDELAPLRAKGARVASVHPMMTFVHGATPEMRDVAFAIEGDPGAVRIAKSIVQDLSGKPFVIAKQNKVLYHAFGSFASPMVIALMAAMEQVALAAGIRKQDVRSIMLPLLRRTWNNYLVHGADAAFTGPLARGDVATIRKHLRELQKLPKMREVYRALAHSAIDHLPVRNSEMVAKELKATAR